jgi:hypothetical protein
MQYGTVYLLTHILFSGANLLLSELETAGVRRSQTVGLQGADVFQLLQNLNIRKVVL